MDDLTTLNKNHYLKKNQIGRGIQMGVNIYEMVTQRILEQLEKGVIPWRKPWKGNPPMNYITRKAYRGINVLLLPLPGEYMSFKQAKELGGHVRKGEKGHIICFYKPLEIDDQESGETKMIPYLKYSTIFHLSQIDGIESKVVPLHLENEIKPLEQAQNIFDRYIEWSGVTVNHVKGSDKASYNAGRDEMTLPLISQFISSNEYASTGFHEAAHSTGHKSRLNRNVGTAAFGSKTYSREELIAEITSAMLMNECGAELPDTFENSASYINSWMQKLKEDNTAIIKASSAAQKAADMILLLNVEK